MLWSLSLRHEKLFLLVAPAWRCSSGSPFLLREEETGRAVCRATLAAGASPAPGVVDTFRITWRILVLLFQMRAVMLQKQKYFKTVSTGEFGL